MQIKYILSCCFEDWKHRTRTDDAFVASLFRHQDFFQVDSEPGTRQHFVDLPQLVVLVDGGTLESLLQLGESRLQRLFLLFYLRQLCFHLICGWSVVWFQVNFITRKSSKTYGFLIFLLDICNIFRLTILSLLTTFNF